MSTIRSAMRIASSGSCVTTMVVAPVSRRMRHRLVPDGVAHPAVEVGERLVHQQHAGARRDRAGQRDPLLLAARKHVRKVPGVALQPDAGERAPRRRLDIARGQASQPEGTLSRIVRCGNSA